MIKKALLLMLIICLLVSCNNSQKTKSDIITVGINLTLSGKAADWGVELKKGLDLAWDVYNDTCKKNAINPVYEDNQLSTRQAVSISRKFIDVDNVSVVISCYTTIVKATKEIINSAGIPLIATVASAEDITGDLNWVFRDFIRESNYMPLIADYAFNNAGYDYGTSLVINDDFGLDARRFFEASFTEFGGSMDAGEVFEVSEMEHRTKINKILSDNPDFVLLVGRGAAMINACRQIKEVAKDMPVLTTVSINNRNIWDGLGDAGNGIVFAEIDVDKSTEEYHKINIRSEEVFGQPLNWVSIYGYSIGKYLAEMIYKHGNNKEAIRNALENLDEESIRGRIYMDDQREVNTPLVVKRHENGVNILIKTNN